MSRKHFQSLAYAIQRTPLSPADKLELAKKVADVCKQTNELFDRERFYYACGVTDTARST